MGLIQPADEIRPRVRQREARAATQSMRRSDLQRLDVAQRNVLCGNEAIQVELARRAKQNAAPMCGLAGRRMRSPRRVALGELERRCIGRLVALPARDGLRKRELERLHAIGRPDQFVDAGAQPIAVERRGDVGLVRIHRLALHELTLDGVERRKLVMPRFERLHVRLDAK